MAEQISASVPAGYTSTLNVVYFPQLGMFVAILVYLPELIGTQRVLDMCTYARGVEGEWCGRYGGLELSGMP